MRAHLSLVDAVVTETPVAFVAHLAPPVTLVRPRGAVTAESTALEAEVRVICRQGATALRPTGNLFRRQVTSRS